MTISLRIALGCSRRPSTIRRHGPSGWRGAQSGPSPGCCEGWTWVRIGGIGGNCGWLSDDGGFCVTARTDDEGGCVIARRAQWDHRAAESRANARLIAAAPALLAACEGLVDCPTVVGMAAHIRDGARRGGREDERAVARAAIKLAKGE